jgi:hypothetical protein
MESKITSLLGEDLVMYHFGLLGELRRDAYSKTEPSKADSHSPNVKANEVLQSLQYKMPCACVLCLSQYRLHWEFAPTILAYSGRLTAEDAIVISRYYRQSISRNRELVRTTILSNGDKLLKKWRRSRKAREKSLKKAEPNLYPKRLPLLYLADHWTGKKVDQSQRSVCLVPYLNLESLLDDASNLMKLLHYRAFSNPHDWLLYDNAQLQPAWKQGAVTEKFATGCISMHGGDLGETKEFDGEEVHRGEAFGTPRAIMILEAQHQLWEFLAKVTSAILEDTETSAAAAQAAPPPTASLSTGITVLAPDSKWVHYLEAERYRETPSTSFGSVFASQPFSAPPQFNIDTLLETATSMAAETQDELWSLQTNPEYFFERASYYEGHWYDSVQELGEDYTDRLKYDNVGYIMTLNVLYKARDAQWLVDECQAAKKEFLDCELDIEVGRPLPSAYEYALASLHAGLMRKRLLAQDSLGRLVTRSPHFRSIFQSSSEPDGEISTALNEVELEKDRLGWCLCQLIKDPDNSPSIEPTLVLQHLDKLLASQTPEEPERLDGEMFRWLSDLTAIENMLDPFQYHQPRFCPMSPYGSYGEKREAWQLVNENLQKFYRHDVASKIGLGASLNPLSQFRVPECRKEKKWLAQRDRAYAAVSSIWKKAREGFQQMYEEASVPLKTIEPLLELMRQCDSSDHTALLTAEREEILGQLQAEKEEARIAAEEVQAAVEKVKAAAKKAQAKADKAQSAAEKAQADLEIAQEIAQAEMEVAQAVAKKAQAKAHLGPTSGSEPSHEATKAPPVLYTLKRGSITQEIVSIMFPESRDESIKGTVPWSDFAKAMADLNFKMKPVGGSMVTFQGEIMLPTSLAPQKRSILVHRPHPGNEMTRVKVRKEGSRCSRRFLWQRANFEME